MTDVLIVGSINLDRIARVAAFPLPGETVASRGYEELLGGKGLNQAVALAAEGVRVALLGSAGRDEAGELVCRLLDGEGIDRRLVSRRGRTGTALILVADDGDNTIALVAGANATVTPEDAERAAERIGAADLVLAQLELPVPTVIATAKEARRRSTPFVLNAAPAQQLPDDLLAALDTLIVNETELATIAGARVPATAEELTAAAARVHGRGVRRLVVTLGGAGALLRDADGETRFEAPTTAVEDTTGAGDVFVATYCARIVGGRGAREAVAEAVEAASASVRVAGTPAARAQLRLLGTGGDRERPATDSENRSQ
jgi:ribokinase